MESKRSLGQNFFINRNLCEQISQIVLKENPEILVEIGPGTGSFTKFLNNSDIHTILIEKDRQLFNDLLTNFPDQTVINSDFLDWDLVELEQYRDKRLIFFGSLPYNVSKPIIRKIISSKYFKNPSYFIVQKEVAEKYIKKEPDNTFLSVQTQVFADTKRLFDISPDSFKPRPKVNSSFVCFSPTKNAPSLNIPLFERFLILCFQQPRKTLKNNLKKVKIIEDERTKELLSKRAQHLSLDDFIYLFSNVPDLLI